MVEVMNMAEKTEAQKRAQKAYIEKFARIEVRISPNERDAIQAHAKAKGESVNTFIKRAILEAMERDNAAPTEDIGIDPEK